MRLSIGEVLESCQDTQHGEKGIAIHVVGDT